MIAIIGKQIEQKIVSEIRNVVFYSIRGDEACVREDECRGCFDTDQYYKQKSDVNYNVLYVCIAKKCKVTELCLYQSLQW